jgi:hypothetical protein
VFKSPKSPDESYPGIVTVVNWTMAPDGGKYLFFWSARWQVLTDGDIPVERFRSSERWQMAAISESGDVLAVFPGCQVKAWIQAAEPPEQDCYAFEKNEKKDDAKQ